MFLENNKTLDYKNKIILAPMVRMGTLPTRLLALDMGADIVYTEELVDLRLIKCKRVINHKLDSVDYIDTSDDSVVFRTCDLEKHALVMQIGTSDVHRAVKLGKLVQQDISGLDVNMGCPKEFSIKGGMGVALLYQADKAANILKALVENLSIPVTCKIRILPNLEDTINLVKKFEATGISAIAIHARTRDERPQHKPHPEYIKEIVKHINIPIIANGGSRDIQEYQDILKFKHICSASSVMVARAAQLNVSIFRKEGLLPIDEIIVRYLKLCVDYDNPPHNTKYVIQSILRELQMTPKGKQFLQCQTMQQMCDLWNLGDYCRQKQSALHCKSNLGRRKVIPEKINPTENEDDVTITSKKSKSNDNCIVDVIEENVFFLRCNYTLNDDFPKSVLYSYAHKNKQLPIEYETEGRDKLFRSTCIFNNKFYRSAYWYKNKRHAEQAAALVCLKNLGLVTEDELINNGSIFR